MLTGDNPWIGVKDGDARARALYHRHYSYRAYKDGRKPMLFCGPGEKMVLLTEDCDALFVWRKFISMDKQDGVSCAVFRNEGGAKGATSSGRLKSLRGDVGRVPGCTRMSTLAKLRRGCRGFVSWRRVGSIVG